MISLEIPRVDKIIEKESRTVVANGLKKGGQGITV